MSRQSGKKVLHLFGAFDPDIESARAASAINALGRHVRNAIVSQDREARGAAHLLGTGIAVSWPKFPSLEGRPWPGRLKGLAAAMSGHDLICTYGWGAVDAALAHTLFADVFKLAPLVHHEFAPDPAELAKGGSFGRRSYRRIAFGRSAAIIVGSPQAERLALDIWQQPRTRVQLIPEGVDTRAFAEMPPRDVLPSFIKRKGEGWIGTLADGIDRDGLAVLVGALRALADEWQVVVLGEIDASLREDALTLAEEQQVDHRLHFTGKVNVAGVMGLFDMLALSRLQENAARAVAGAMSASVPLVMPRGGETGAMPSSDNGQFLFGTSDEDVGEAMLDRILVLCGDPTSRKRAGKANRARAREHYDAQKLMARQLALYRSLMGTKGAVEAEAKT